MPGGPAKRLVKFAKDCKEKKLKAFSSYRSLKEVLIRNGLESEGTDKIPLFSLQTHEIQESDKHFEHCMAEILVRLKITELWSLIAWKPCVMSMSWQFFIPQSILQEILQGKSSA
jgi:hypothetical protein